MGPNRSAESEFVSFYSVTPAPGFPKRYGAGRVARSDVAG